MANESERRIYRLCAICAALTAASLIVPRFAANPDGGFAAGASAAITFLLILGAALLVSLYLLGLTMKKFANLSTVARITGISPSLILTAALMLLIVYLGR